MNNQYPLNKFEPNTEAYVKGTIEFCRIASHIDGEELKRDQDWRRQRGSNPVMGPYTRISIVNPQIVPSDKGKTVFETYLEQDRFFKSTKDNGMRFTAENKNPNGLPLVSRMKNNTPEEIKLEKDLAPGSNVLVKVRVFKSKNQTNHGLTLDAVVITDPEIQYYTGNGTQNIAADLAARGIGVAVDAQPEYQPNAYAAPPAPSAGIINPAIAQPPAAAGITIPV